jgi:hypothetical protein
MDEQARLTPREAEIVSGLYARADMIRAQAEEQMRQLNEQLNSIFVLIDDRHGSTLAEGTQRIDNEGYIVDVTPEEMAGQ